MPGFILHEGAVVLCLHAGTAEPIVTNPRVQVNGQPITVQSSVYTVAGCTLPPPPVANGPCVTCTWVMAAARVTASGVPVLLQDSIAVCVPTGTGVEVVYSQVRVKAT